MAALFSTPKVPAPTAPPSQSAAEVQAAQDESRRQAGVAAGRGSTVLTPAGYSGADLKVATKTLFGE